MMVDGAAAVAQPGVGSDRRVDEAFGAPDRVMERQAEREAGGDGCRVSAPGAVGVPGVDSRGGEVDEIPAVVEKVEGVVRAMAAFDERGAGSHGDESSGGAAHVGCAGEGLRLREVGGDE